jgi:hypothetical protein
MTTTVALIPTLKRASGVDQNTYFKKIIACHFLGAAPM